MRAHWGRRAGAAAAIVMLAAACGGSTKPAADNTPSPSRPSSPPTISLPATSPPSSPASKGPNWSSTQAAVIAAYTKFWAALPRASQTTNEDARLRLLFPYTTEPELPQLISKLWQQRHKGQVLYGAEVPHVRSVTVSGHSASVFDCQDASHAGVARTSDHSHITVGVKRNPVSTTLLLRGSDWKVSVVDFPKDAQC